MAHAIQITDLVKHYRGAEHAAVNGLSVQVDVGEFFGLLGPNGAGKTTTLSILCGLLRADSGSVQVLGRNVLLQLKEVKPLIGVVPQDIALYDTLTARENLMFFGAMYGLSWAQVRQKADVLLDRFGLLARANDQVQHFSGGMKRRVNLIAALLHDPQILILDEPTVGIDVQSRTLINDHLMELNQSGMTIIYTGHHLEEAERLCARIMIVDQGQCMAQGEPRQLAHQHGVADLEAVFLKLTGRALRD